MSPPKIVAYSPYPEGHACAYIRIAAPMCASGWNVVWAKESLDGGSGSDVRLARNADLIVIQRQFPALKREKLLAALFRLGIPVVYDLDDMLLHLPESHPSSAELARRAPFIKWALNEADLVTVSTAPLSRLLETETGRPIRVQPNLVDWPLFEAPPGRRDGHGFRFLVSGTSTHSRDWAIIEEPLAEILARHPGAARAVFFGEVPARFAGHPSVESIGFDSDYRSYAARLRALDVDAALVPLEDTTFNRCKSNIKWLEYSAVGIAGAYSDVTPYSSSIEHQRSGLLVENTSVGWFDAMSRLLTHRDEVDAMAEASRRQVLGEFSIESGVRRYASVYAELFGREHRRAMLTGAATLGARIGARLRQSLADSAFINRHVRWRLNKR